MTIRYEDLVRSTEEAVRMVCRFLRLDFEENMLLYHRNQPENVNITREPWKASVARAIDPTLIDRWRLELSTKQVARIEALIWPEMNRWCYRPDTALLRRVALAGLTRPAESVRKIVRLAMRKRV